MSENLNKKPPKGILKTSSSFDKAGTSNAVPPPNIAAASDMTGSMHRKSAKFDEMNIIETLHPPDKDYGHMKIEEPKTPFNYYEDGEDMEQQGVDPHTLQKRLESATVEDTTKSDNTMDATKEVDEEDEEDDEEEEGLDPEERARRNQFESKRKAHYNEYYAVKLARKLLEQEEDEEDNNGTEAEAEDSRGGDSNDAQGFIPNEELD